MSFLEEIRQNITTNTAENAAIYGALALSFVTDPHVYPIFVEWQEAHVCITHPPVSSNVLEAARSVLSALGYADKREG